MIHTSATRFKRGFLIRIYGITRIYRSGSTCVNDALSSGEMPKGADHKMKMSAQRAATLAATHLAMGVIEKLWNSKSVDVNDVAEARDALQRAMNGQVAENVALIGSPGFHAVQSLVAAANVSASAAAAAKAHENKEILDIHSVRQQLTALAASAAVTKAAHSWSAEEDNEGFWRSSASGQIYDAGCPRSTEVGLGDVIAVAFYPKLPGPRRGPPTHEIAACNAEQDMSVFDGIWEPCWIKRSGSGFDVTLVDHFDEKQVERFLSVAPQFVRPLEYVAATVWKGTVTSIDELEMHGAVDVAFPAGDDHAAWEARVECRRIQQIITDGRVVRGEPGWSIASMIPLLEKSKLAKLGTPKKGKKKAKKGKKARASNGGSGQRVANGGNAATPEQRLYAALLLISKKMHAIECNGGKKRNIGLRDVEIGVIDTLRTHDWKVSRTQLLAWVAELKGLEAKAGVHDEAPTGLGLRMGRPMDLSPEVVVDIIQFFLHPGGGTSSHPNEQNFVIELKKRHHKQYTDAGYAPLQYEGMRKPLVRKYVKIIETFFRPGPAVKERSKMRQIQMTSMINAINEFIMAETLQRIFPGHYVAKELLFNYDPTTLVYNLLKRSKGMGLSLFPAGFDLPVKAPIASKGGAAKLSHALKMHIITMALGREGPTFLEVKIPPGARAGIVGADAAPIVVQIMGWNRARRAAMPVFLLATFPPSAQGVKESESESDSAAEQLFRDYIWPKFFEWIQETRDSMDCPERHHPEYADDHEIWKYAALTLDSSAPECKGILKWFATTEGKESNIGAGKIGAGATGPFQSNDASKLFPAIK